MLGEIEHNWSAVSMIDWPGHAWASCHSLIQRKTNMGEKLFNAAVNLVAFSYVLAVALSLGAIVVFGGPDALGGFLFEGAIPILDRR